MPYCSRTYSATFRLFALIACSLIGRSVGAQQSTATTMPASLTQVILERERAVWEAIKRKDRQADAALLADDFVGLYDTGFGTKAEHVAQMGHQFTLSAFTLSNVRVKAIDDNSALLMYKATCTATGTWKDDCAKPMYVSLLWVRRSGRWLNVFSQDTRAR